MSFPTSVQNSSASWYCKRNTRRMGLHMFTNLFPCKTDEELYKKYKLTQPEIDFIDSMIRPMEDK